MAKSGKYKYKLFEFSDICNNIFYITDNDNRVKYVKVDKLWHEMSHARIDEKHSEIKFVKKMTVEDLFTELI